MRTFHRIVTQLVGYCQRSRLHLHGLFFLLSVVRNFPRKKIFRLNNLDASLNYARLSVRKVNPYYEIGFVNAFRNLERTPTETLNQLEESANSYIRRHKLTSGESV